jgi:ATP-dependent Lon protease
MPRKPTSDKKNRLKKSKKHVPSADDDSSVDSKGNVRNLIDYDYDEDDEEEMEEMTDSTYTDSEYVLEKKQRPPPRKAAVRAARRIRRLTEPDDSEESVKYKKSSRKIEVKKRDKKVSNKEMKRNHIVEDTSDSDSSLEDVKPKTQKSRHLKSKAKKPRVRKEETETEESTETESSDSDEDTEDTDDDDEDDEDDEMDDEDMEDEKSNRAQRIGLMISSFGAAADPKQPKKHKMKDQPPIVQKFVKLVQKEGDNEENAHTIDTDISYFKQLSEGKQNLIIEKMERKFSIDEAQVPLKFKILEKQVPQQVEKLALGKYNALMNMDASTSEYYKGFHWIEGYSNLPIGTYRDLPVKLEDGGEACATFVTKVRQNMDEAIFGHDEAKLQILQFVSSWIANPKGIGNVLSIHGPMGVGKTTLVKNGIAKALERPFHFISLGGASDASYLDGHSYTYEGSTWGRIADILMQSKCMNPIIYFDELDKISDTPKGEEIMNLLIHITDGSQNDKFQDKYFSGIDLDISRCLFIFSHNNHERVNPILRDRMYNIKVSGFNLKEKQVIAEQYLIDQTLKEIGLFEKLSISKEVVQHIIEEFTGDEKGVRELKRSIHTIMSKLNLLRFYNDPKKVPFSIPDFSLPFILKKEHINLLLKKREEEDQSWKSLYN